MTEQPNVQLEASPEQVLYATILEKGMLIGLILLLVTFALYGFGVMEPFIPVEDLPRYWTHGVAEYLHAANIKAGWSWLGMVRYGDFVNFIGIATLAGVTVVCYVAIIPTLLRNNDRLYAFLAFLEAFVLSVAASGVLGTGGH